MAGHMNNILLFWVIPYPVGYIHRTFSGFIFGLFFQYNYFSPLSEVNISMQMAHVLKQSLWCYSWKWGIFNLQTSVPFHSLILLCGVCLEPWLTSILTVDFGCMLGRNNTYQCNMRQWYVEILVEMWSGNGKIIEEILQISPRSKY